jgi:hypothetical protein
MTESKNVQELYIFTHLGHSLIKFDTKIWVKLIKTYEYYEFSLIRFLINDHATDNRAKKGVRTA